jgi:hypothetical protein
MDISSKTIAAKSFWALICLVLMSPLQAAVIVSRITNLTSRPYKVTLPIYNIDASVSKGRPFDISSLSEKVQNQLLSNQTLYTEPLDDSVTAESLKNYYLYLTPESSDDMFKFIIQFDGRYLTVTMLANKPISLGDQSLQVGDPVGYSFSLDIKNILQDSALLMESHKDLWPAARQTDTEKILESLVYVDLTLYDDLSWSVDRITFAGPVDNELLREQVNPRDYVSGETLDARNKPDNKYTIVQDVQDEVGA